VADNMPMPAIIDDMETVAIADPGCSPAACRVKHSFVYSSSNRRRVWAPGKRRDLAFEKQCSDGLP
jgi:hypothetical protein